MRSDDRRSAQSLASLADKKAKDLESHARAERMQGWRVAIGATTDGTNVKTPTRLAYRWLKGLTGWD